MSPPETVIGELADLISVGWESARGRYRVAVDGRVGAGKVLLADGLAEVLRERGMEVHRAGIDDWQLPAAVRNRRGRDSPEGYYFDAFNYVGVKRELLEPFSSSGNGRCRLAAYDVKREVAVGGPRIEAGKRALLLVDGVFLLRPELAKCWELTIYVQAEPSVLAERGAIRSGSGTVEHALANRRHAPGQDLYHDAVSPLDVADIVVDNTDREVPVIVRS